MIGITTLWVLSVIEGISIKRIRVVGIWLLLYGVGLLQSGVFMIDDGGVELSIFPLVGGGMEGVGGTLRRVNASYRKTLIGRVLSDVDEGVTPRGFLEFKRRYMLGLGKAVFLAGFARGLYRLLLGLGMLKGWYVYVVYMLMGLVIIVNILHMIDFIVSLSYVLYIYSKGVRGVYRQFHTNRVSRGRAAWETLRASMRGKIPNPGGPEFNKDMVLRMMVKAGKYGAGATGVLVTGYTAGQVWDNINGCNRFGIGFQRFGYNIGRYKNYSGILETSKSMEAKQLVEKYGEINARLLMDNALRETNMAYWDLNSHSVDQGKRVELVKEAMRLGDKWGIKPRS